VVSSPSPATIFPHTPRTLLGYACSPSNAFRRPAISIVTPHGREESRKTGRRGLAGRVGQASMQVEGPTGNAPVAGEKGKRTIPPSNVYAGRFWPQLRTMNEIRSSSLAGWRANARARRRIASSGIRRNGNLRISRRTIIRFARRCDAARLIGQTPARAWNPDGELHHRYQCQFHPCAEHAAVCMLSKVQDLTFRKIRNRSVQIGRWLVRSLR
jgi:hypothetical protein